MIYHSRPCRIGLAICAAAALVLTFSCPAFPTQVTKQLAPGVSLYQDINTDPASALIVNAVTVDLSSSSVTVKPSLARDVVYTDSPSRGRETVSSITGRNGALVGVNADFCPFTGDPLGLCIIDGQLVSEPARNRAAVGWSREHGVVFDNPRFKASLTLSKRVGRQIDGINRIRETNQVIVYTDTFGATTRNKYEGTDIVLGSNDLPVRLGKSIELTVTDVKVDAVDTPIPKGGMVISAGGPAAWFLKENLKPGDTLSVRFDVASAGSHDWAQVEQAVGGGPWLVKDGKEFIDWAEENFKITFACASHPRTAVGVTADGKLLIVTVDGRQAISRGINLPDLASLMKRLGAVNAINLDGGASTAMSVAGIVINSPSGGTERPVANALLVYAQRISPAELPNLSISGVEIEVPSGSGAQLFLTWGDEAQMLTEDQLDHAVWGTTNGVGFVNQKGYFTPVAVRRGKVNAIYGSQLVGLGIEVVSGKPAQLAIQLLPDEQDPLRAWLKVTVSNADLNTLARKDVLVEVCGGRPDIAAGTTDDKGKFTAGITWNAAAPVRSVKATADGVSGSVTLEADESQPESGHGL